MSGRINSDPRFKTSRSEEFMREAQGLGDTVANIAHALCLDKVAEAYTHATGKDCGCAARQAALNKVFPYKIKP